MEEHHPVGLVAGGQQQGAAERPFGSVLAGEGDGGSVDDQCSTAAERRRLAVDGNAEVRRQGAQLGVEE